MNMIEYLKGKKAYIVAAGALLTAFGAWLGGEVTTKEFIEAVFAAASIATLRAGIAKASFMIPILALLTLCSGCIMPREGFGQSRKINGYGLHMTYQGSGIILGWINIMDQAYPVSTNQLFAAPYHDGLGIESTGWVPWRNNISMSTFAGNVSSSTNATGKAIVPAPGAGVLLNSSVTNWPNPYGLSITTNLSSQ